MLTLPNREHIAEPWITEIYNLHLANDDMYINRKVVFVKTYKVEFRSMKMTSKIFKRFCNQKKSNKWVLMENVTN